ncbi:hypothetical protein ACI3PL_30685, partial [Lacticaseibacillus paracasei]
FSSHVQVVGWGFKQERFEKHAAALGLALPAYVGCGEPVDLPGALSGEEKTVALYSADPLGNSGTLLQKRRARNPFN